ncbi:hypothetical protein OSB04_010096 [Centaurea solstitialis]|uniref:Uncharacterized protein n=1 Tax=Centaurea solstitialis TaxID=347529 RepID=A0AA38WCH9_9ASTR|nr:hypothetical protein OSB04_010096 [Centaurea solstitialis]
MLELDPPVIDQTKIPLAGMSPRYDEKQLRINQRTKNRTGFALGSAPVSKEEGGENFLNELEKQYVARVKEMKRKITGEAVQEEEAYNPFGKVEKWEVISQSNRLYYKLDRHGGYKDFWKTFSDLLEHCSRDNLKEIFEHGMAVYGEVLNEGEVEDAIVDKIKKALEWLCMLFDVNRVQDLIVQDVEIVNQWVLYESCGVYAVVCDGSNCEYYLVEGDYNHSLIKLQKMIEKGLSCSISSEMGADLQVGETTAKSSTLLLITQSTAEKDKVGIQFVSPVVTRFIEYTASHALLTGNSNKDFEDLGFDSDVYVNNAIIHLLLSCGELEDAHNVFDESCQRDLVSWNSIINGAGGHGRP